MAHRLWELPCPWLPRQANKVWRGTHELPLGQGCRLCLWSTLTPPGSRVEGRSTGSSGPVHQQGWLLLHLRLLLLFLLLRPLGYRCRCSCRRVSLPGVLGAEGAEQEAVAPRALLPPVLPGLAPAGAAGSLCAAGRRSPWSVHCRRDGPAWAYNSNHAVWGSSCNQIPSAAHPCTAEGTMRLRRCWRHQAQLTACAAVGGGAVILVARRARRRLLWPQLLCRCAVLLRGFFTFAGLFVIRPDKFHLQAQVWQVWRSGGEASKGQIPMARPTTCKCCTWHASKDSKRERWQNKTLPLSPLARSRQRRAGTRITLATGELEASGRCNQSQPPARPIKGVALTGTRQPACRAHSGWNEAKHLGSQHCMQAPAFCCLQN